MCTNGDVYASATVGGYISAPGIGQACYPSCNPNPSINGAYVGIGGGVNGSTAKEAQGNSGPFECTLLAVGAGVGGTISTCQGTYGNEPVNTAEVGVFGPGYGVGGANYNTNTWVGSCNVWNTPFVAPGSPALPGFGY